VTECIILAGGKGTRMARLEDGFPKVMNPVNSRPFLEHVIANLATQGVNRFVVGVGHGADYVEEWASKHSRYGTLVLVNSGPQATRYARLQACIRELIDESVLVTYGDGLADVSVSTLRRTHVAANVPVTITVAPLSCQFGVAELSSEGLIEAFYEKPRLDKVLVNIGYMWFSSIADVLDAAAASLEKQILPELADQGALGGYVHYGYWRNMDTPADLKSARADAERGIGPWLNAS
jgi:glucose-1-phosphate cytidylyltransferase